MRRVALALALMLVAGCDRLFSLIEVQHASDGSLVDGEAPVDMGVDDNEPPHDAMPDSMVDARPDATPDAPGAACPATYANPRNGSRYRLVATATTWLAAQTACKNDQIAGSTKYTHLVVVSDDPERSFLYANVAGSNGQLHWLGYSDRVTEGTFKWVSTQTGYPGNGDDPWGSTEPSGGDADDCVYMDTLVAFHDEDCAKAHPFICECDDFPDAPANY